MKVFSKMEPNVDWNSVCLVCLQEGLMHSIYDEDETGIKINEKIIKCTNIDLNLETNFPEQICSSCLSDLIAAFRFKTNCENSHQILKSLYNDEANKCVSQFNESKKNYEERINSTSSQIMPKKRFKKGNLERNLNQDVKIEFVQNDFEENIPLLLDSEHVNEEIYPSVTEFLKNKTQIKTEPDTFQINSYTTKTKTRSKVKPPKRYHDILDYNNRPNRYKNKNSSKKITTIKSLRGSKEKVMISTNSETGKVESTEKNEKLVCEMCGNTYKYANALRVHMLRHDNVRQFKCELCPKAFVADTDLKRHMRVHTGEKPYACKYCDRRFSDFGSRGKHERTHTGERPYKCQMCNKSFSYSHVLNVHQLVHTGVKRFKCNICEKGFTKKLYLEKHMKNHACEIRYDIHEVKGNGDAIRRQNDDSLDTNYEPDLNTDINCIQENADSLEIPVQKSIFTIVKTESGVAEVQYYLPVVE